MAAVGQREPAAARAALLLALGEKQLKMLRIEVRHIDSRQVRVLSPCRKSLGREVGAHDHSNAHGGQQNTGTTQQPEPRDGTAAALPQPPRVSRSTDVLSLVLSVFRVVPLLLTRVPGKAVSSAGSRDDARRRARTAEPTRRSGFQPRCMRRLCRPPRRQRDRRF